MKIDNLRRTRISQYNCDSYRVDQTKRRPLLKFQIYEYEKNASDKRYRPRSGTYLVTFDVDFQDPFRGYFKIIYVFFKPLLSSTDYERGKMLRLVLDTKFNSPLWTCED